MAWIYLAVSEDLRSHSADTLCLSLTVKTTSTLSQSCLVKLAEVIYPSPPSGMTYELLKQMTLGQLISYTEDFPVRILALQEMEQVWEESARDFSLKSSDYVAIFDQDSFSWKTSQLSLFGDLTEFVWSSLRSGMIVDGRIYQPPQLEPVISETVGGFLPTPTAQEYGSNQRDGQPKRPGLSTIAKLRTPLATEWKNRTGTNSKMEHLQQQVGGQLSPMWVEWLMGYRTGWTELEDWATQWFRSKRGQRLKN